MLTNTEQAGPEELFSAKNHVPEFWLGLLDAQALDEPLRHWRTQAQLVANKNEEELERFTDIWPALTNQQVDLESLRRNRARTARLLARYHPGQLPLFEEFCHFLLAQLPGPDDCLQFDLTNPGDSQGLLEFLAGLRQQVAAFEADAPLPWALPPKSAGLTGLPVLAQRPDPAAYPLLSAATLPPPRAPAALPAPPPSWWRRLWRGW